MQTPPTSPLRYESPAAIARKLITPKMLRMRETGMLKRKMHTTVRRHVDKQAARMQVMLMAPVRPCFFRHPVAAADVSGRGTLFKLVVHSPGENGITQAQAGPN